MLRCYVSDRVEVGAKVYTDDHVAYRGLRNHETVRHSVGEYVDGHAHTNGIESFWSLLKRGYYGTHEPQAPRSRDRVRGARGLDTIDQMGALAQGMIGKRLRYQDLVA